MKTTIPDTEWENLKQIIKPILEGRVSGVITSTPFFRVDINTHEETVLIKLRPWRNDERN